MKRRIEVQRRPAHTITDVCRTGRGAGYVLVDSRRMNVSVDPAHNVPAVGASASRTGAAMRSWPTRGT